MSDATRKKLATEKAPEAFAERLKKAVTKKYKDQEEAFTEDILRKIEKEIHIQVLDTLWMQHLENMQHLREGINWRSVGQKDPLVEYRREGQRMFETMQAEMRGEIIKSLFHARPVSKEEVEEPIETELTRAAAQSVESGASESGGTKTRKAARRGTKVTRKTESAEPRAVAAVTEEDEKAEKKKKRAASKKKKAKRKKGRR